MHDIEWHPMSYVSSRKDGQKRTSLMAMFLSVIHWVTLVSAVSPFVGQEKCWIEPAVIDSVSRNFLSPQQVYLLFTQMIHY